MLLIMSELLDLNLLSSFKVYLFRAYNLDHFLF